MVIETWKCTLLTHLEQQMEAGLGERMKQESRSGVPQPEHTIDIIFKRNIKRNVKRNIIFHSYSLIIRHKGVRTHSAGVAVMCKQCLIDLSHRCDTYSARVES